MLGAQRPEALGATLVHDPKTQRFVLGPLSCDPSAQGPILRPLKRNKAVAEAPLEVLKLRKSPFPIFLAIQSLDAGALSLHRLSDYRNKEAENSCKKGLPPLEGPPILCDLDRGVEQPGSSSGS